MFDICVPLKRQTNVQKKRDRQEGKARGRAKTKYCVDG
jgi:hypothetical protein